MRTDQHIHTIHDLYLFLERLNECKRCKLFQDNIAGNLIELYDEFVRANNQEVDDEKKEL